MIKFKPFENLKTDFRDIEVGGFFKMVNDDDPEKICLRLTGNDYYDFDEEEIRKISQCYGCKTIPLNVDIHVRSLLEEQMVLKNFHEKYQDVRIFLPHECVIREKDKDDIPCGEFFKTEDNNVILALDPDLYFNFNDCNVHMYSEITGDVEMLDVEIEYAVRNERKVTTNE